MQYIENSDIDVSQVITITDNITVVGSNGTEMTFLKFRQYVMCSETEEIVECDICLGNETMIKQSYQICINSERFLIPKIGACIEGYIRKEYEQDLRKYWDKKYTFQPRDYKKVVSDAIGREINTGNPDIANQDEYDRIQREKGRNNGKQYGSVNTNEMEI